MRNKLIFGISALGLLTAVVSAVLFSRQPQAQTPVFNPAASPYAHGIFSNGIIESDQGAGSNINIYPEIPGAVTGIPVHEGQQVHKGDPLLTIDDSVQRATAAQQAAQSQAALAQLQELRREPRPETLAVAAAQVVNARAALKAAQDERSKQQHAYDMDPRAVSRDALDGAVNAEAVAAASLDVVRRQYDLTRAGAWVYDIRNQEQQYRALSQAAAAAAALLDKYTLRAPADGIVLAVQAAVGSYVSPQGAYDTYTQAYDPLIVMGLPQQHLAVRAYVDEILVHELPAPGRIRAEMVIRGTGQHVPLSFLRIQPYISPKIQLSDARTERVDLRVLPVIFRFENAGNLDLYPGQLVDVYLAGK